MGYFCNGASGKWPLSFVRYFKGVRSFQTGVFLKNDVTKSSQKVTSNTSSSGLNFSDHSVTKLEKYVLVWVGKYKSVKDVPNLLNYDEVDRARNKARIRISNIMIAATLVGCVAMIISGKRAAASGESVVKMRNDFHKDYQKACEAKETKDAKEE